MKKRIIWIVMAIVILVVALGLLAGRKETATLDTDNGITAQDEQEEYLAEDAVAESVKETDVEETKKYTEEELENIEYSDYMEMSGEEQVEVFESYENPDDFFEWYNSEKEQIEKVDVENENISDDNIEEPEIEIIMESEVLEIEEKLDE